MLRCNYKEKKGCVLHVMTESLSKS